VDSVAAVPDGHTVVVGGLELTTASKDRAETPLVARVPILGELFKNRSKSQSRSRFYVFIRATVLRNAAFEDLRFVSDLATESAAVPGGLPHLAPRVIR
jgi:type II secretory pathway component GspD/PulD (secretin)